MEDKRIVNIYVDWGYTKGLHNKYGLIPENPFQNLDEITEQAQNYCISNKKGGKK